MSSVGHLDGEERIKMLMPEEVTSVARRSNDQTPASHHLAGTREPAQSIAGGILIIEDHAMVLGVLQASLRRLCPTVEQVCVRSARAALKIVRREWLRVFVDPDVAGVDGGSLVHELACLGLARRCCLITTRPQQMTKCYLQGVECLMCISTRMPIDEFNEALARAALGITAPEGTSCEDPVQRFTTRHVELLRLLQRGLQNKAIAHELGITEGTVKNHLRSLMKRLGVRNRIQAAQEAARFGIA